MAFGSNDQELIDRLKLRLSEAFKVKLLGTLNSFIGWEITKTSHGLTAKQPTYIRHILRLYNLSHITPTSTPIPIKCDLTPLHDGDVPLTKIQHNLYRSVIGSLSYLAICTRPDISFKISSLSRQLHAPSERHLILAKRVVRYVSGTANKSILFPHSSISQKPLTAYSDADWGGCHETQR